MEINDYQLQCLKDAFWSLREILNSRHTETIEVELPDHLVIWLFQECSKMEMTPNEMFDHIIESYLHQIGELEAE